MIHLAIQFLISTLKSVQFVLPFKFHTVITNALPLSGVNMDRLTNSYGCVSLLLLRVCWSLFICIISFNASALTEQPIQLSETFSQGLTAPHVSFYVDESNTLTLNEVKDETFNYNFQPLTADHINQGITSKSYWLKFTLKNPTLNDIQWVLFHETTYLDLLSVYVKEGNNAWQGISTSDHLPFSERANIYRKLNYSHTTNAAGESLVLVNLKMLQSDTTTLAFHLTDQATFTKLVVDEQWYYGHFFGASLSIIVLSLIIWTKTQARYAFNYTSYLVTHMLMWAFFTGYIYQYILADDPYIYNMGFHISYLLFYIAAVQFTKSFLNTALHLPRVTEWINISQLVAGAAILLRLFGEYEVVLYVSYFFLTLLILQPILGWYCYKKGDSAVKWFSLGWGVFSVGLCLSVISASTGLFNWGMEPIIYTQIAGLLESILLAFALAERISQTQHQLFKVMEESQRDALTGLGNRRMLDYYISEYQTKQSRRLYHPRWLLLLDIDNFKTINDEYGHVVGDETLKSIANTIVHSCRSSDVAIRYGGEEFLVILDGADKDTMLHIANRIKNTIAETPIVIKQANINMTVSIGATPLSFEQLLEIDEAINMADNALYKVKKSGKNGIALGTQENYQLI